MGRRSRPQPRRVGGVVERRHREGREALPGVDPLLKPLGDRAALCESPRGLAELLLERGRVEEAERFALDARETVGPLDVTSRATTAASLAMVRAAQGRDDEAEELFREAARHGVRHRFPLEIEYEVAAASLSSCAIAGARTRPTALDERRERFSTPRRRARPESPDVTPRPATRVITVAGRAKRARAFPSGSARSVPSPYGRCFVSLRFA